MNVAIIEAELRHFWGINNQTFAGSAMRSTLGYQLEQLKAGVMHDGHCVDASAAEEAMFAQMAGMRLHRWVKSCVEKIVDRDALVLRLAMNRTGICSGMPERLLAMTDAGKAKGSKALQEMQAKVLYDQALRRLDAVRSSHRSTRPAVEGF